VDATDLEMPSMRAQMDRALALADKAIAADRGAAEGWGAKALALNWAYRSHEALTLVRSTRAQHPDDAGLMVVEAEVLAQIADYAGASILLDEAIDILRADSGKAAVARAYYVRGNIAQILGQREQAIAAYEAAWDISRQPYDELHPWNVVPPGYILYQLGPIYLFQGRAADALDIYTAALNIDRQDAFLFYLRGRIYRFQGQLDEAAAEFRLCLDAEPQQWRCMRNLGQMAFERGDWQATIQWFAPLISANSQISDDHYYLVAAYRAIGRCTGIQPVWDRGWSLLQNATGQPYWNTEAFLSIREGC
jgi:tetratricopeptide (TPR) repeat protein